MKETRGKTKGDQEAKGMESKISYMLTAKFVVRERGGGGEKERETDKERGRDVQIERERNIVRECASAFIGKFFNLFQP